MIVPANIERAARPAVADVMRRFLVAVACTSALVVTGLFATPADTRPAPLSPPQAQLKRISSSKPAFECKRDAYTNFLPYFHVVSSGDDTALRVAVHTGEFRLLYPVARWICEFAPMAS